MKFSNRIKKLVEKVDEADRQEERRTGISDEWREQEQRERDAFLSHAPADLRAAVDAGFSESNPESETFASWLLWPFAKWAPPMADDFVFPRALVEFMLSPPRPIWMGHCCERCGLYVPLYLVPSRDPTPPPADLRVFPTCPACGGKTSFSGSNQSGPKLGEQT
jgi:hypothetical protein